MSETKRETTRWSQPEEQVVAPHGEAVQEEHGHHEGKEEHEGHEGEHGKEGHHGEHGEHGDHGSDEEHEHEHFEGDYYDLLEVTRESTTAEIKKSYQRLAMRWHPDKNPENAEKAKKMFQHLGEAYEILSDDHKRDSYNKYGREGMKDHGGEESDEEDMGCGCCAGASDPFEMFKMMFGDIDPYALVMRSMVTPGGIRGMMGGGGCGPMQMPVGRNALVVRRPRRQPMSPYGMPNGRGQMAGYVPNSNTTTTGMLSNGQKVIVRRVVNNGVETTTTYDRTGTLINSNVRVIGPQMRLDNVIPQMMGGCGPGYMDDEEDSDEEEGEEEEEEDDEEEESGEVTNAAVGNKMPPSMRNGQPPMRAGPPMMMSGPQMMKMSGPQMSGPQLMKMKQPEGNNVAAVAPMMRTGAPVTITRINSETTGTSAEAN